MLLILLDACFGCLAFYFVGFALAYGGTYGDETKANKIIGWGGFALRGLPREDWYMWFFQYAVCTPPYTTRQDFCDAASITHVPMVLVCTARSFQH